MKHRRRRALPEKQVTKKEKREFIEAVEKVIAEMELSGSRIDFQTVSRKMGTARSTLYRNKIVRETISSARQRNKLPSNTLDSLQSQIQELQGRICELESRLKDLERSVNPF